MYKTSKTPVPAIDKYSKLYSFRKPKDRNTIKITSKKIVYEEDRNPNMSWTSQILNWRSILQDQKDYRKMINRIELFNQKIKKSKYSK
jgi:hypothetical protein